MSTECIELRASVPEDLQGARLDQAAAQLFGDYSRSRIQQWIKDGALTVDGRPGRQRDKVFGGELLVISAALAAEQSWEPEAIELDIVHEDAALLVINKPAGLVVHPAAGHASGTLLNALLHHCPGLDTLPRAGIVHRLDKDTTGLMVVAKTLAAHHQLVAQLQARTVHREYEAVTVGAVTGGATVDQPIGRHPRQRQKMAVVERGGKPAVTHYRLIRRFRDHSHIRCLLETGRTHQIRVHMASVGYPLLGDPLYGGRLRLPKGADSVLIEQLRGFARQALHAKCLRLAHPDSGEPVQWEVALPTDMQALLQALAAQQSRYGE